MEKALVESVDPIGTEGFYMATIQVGQHGRAITVIGKDLTECVVRTNKVLQAFNGVAK